MPVSLDLSSTGVFSVMGSDGLAALVTVKVVAGSGVGLELPGGAGGGLLTVVNVPLTTASMPVVEVKVVVVLGAMYSGCGGGDGGGGPGDGGGGLGAAEAEHRLSVQHMTRCSEMKMMVGRHFRIGCW